MTQLDRLGWAAGVAFDCHGARIGVRVTESGALARILELLPPGARWLDAPEVDVLYSLVVGGRALGSAVRRFHLLYVGVARLARTLDLDVAFVTLATDMHSAVSSAGKRRVFVRAGVVVLDGRALVIVGPRGSGRTSLVRALVRAGATFASDTFAIFDEQGYVHPYPSPITEVSAHGGPQRLPIPSFDGVISREPVPLALVVETRYRPGAHWRPRARTRAQAALALMRHAEQPTIAPDLALKTLGAAVAHAGALRGTRGECAKATASLLKRLRGHSIAKLT